MLSPWLAMLFPSYSLAELARLWISLLRLVDTFAFLKRAIDVIDDCMLGSLLMLGWKSFWTDAELRIATPFKLV